MASSNVIPNGSRDSMVASIYYHMADTLNAPARSDRFVGYSDEEDFTTAMSDFGTETFTAGDSNAYIANVQRRLNCLGFYSGTVTGALDTATVSAVEAFKQAKGITPVNGTIGSTTKARLYQPM